MKNASKSTIKKSSFTSRFLVGLTIALGLTLTAFEWTTVSTDSKVDWKTDLINSDEEILPPITYRVEELKKPKPVNNTDQLEIVTEIFEPEPEEKPTIEVKPEAEPIAFSKEDYGMGEEVLEEKIPFSKVEIFAHYDECANLLGEESKNCSRLDIVNRINKQFRVSPQLQDINRNQAALMSFIVDEKGNIHSIKALQATSKAMAEDCKKAIERLPRMNPALQQGRPVSLQMEIPIRVSFSN